MHYIYFLSLSCIVLGLSYVVLYCPRTLLHVHIIAFLIHSAHFHTWLFLWFFMSYLAYFSWHMFRCQRTHVRTNQHLPNSSKRYSPVASSQLSGVHIIGVFDKPPAIGCLFHSLLPSSKLQMRSFHTTVCESSRIRLCWYIALGIPEAHPKVTPDHSRCTHWSNQCELRANGWA